MWPGRLELAHRLEADYSIAVIDQNQEAFRRLGADFRGRRVTESGFDRSVLTEAGIAEAHAFAAVSRRRQLQHHLRACRPRDLRRRERRRPSTTRVVPRSTSGWASPRSRPCMDRRPDDPPDAAGESQSLWRDAGNRTARRGARRGELDRAAREAAWRRNPAREWRSSSVRRRSAAR